MAQLRSQFEAVVMDRDLARTLRGKISPVTTQAQGPQEQAKKKLHPISCYFSLGQWLSSVS